MRGTLTTELWETTNQTWLEFQRMLHEGNCLRARSVGRRVRMGEVPLSPVSRGVAVGTMLQDESLHFIRIGTFLERADNTARMLDVKFHALAGDYFGTWGDEHAPEVDFYHWSAILRSRVAASRSTARSIAT